MWLLIKGTGALITVLTAWRPVQASTKSAESAGGTYGSPGVLGRVASIWRYPIMGLQGEVLAAAAVSGHGVIGDHGYVVRDVQTGAVLDPKSHPYSWGETTALSRLIEFKCELLGARGEGDSFRLTMPGGGSREGGAADVGGVLSEALSREVEVVRYPRIVETRAAAGRTIHLLTAASLARIGSLHPSGNFDLRRFRPNIFVELTAEGFVEEDWLGRTLALGRDLRIKVEKPNIRCVVTTLPQGPLAEDKGILESVEKYNGKKLGVMCSVSSGGVVSAGNRLVFA